MIDIHCHILPSIDDGPSRIEESIAMARMALEDGITHVVATPHFRYAEKPSFEDIRQRVEMLAEAIRTKSIPLELMLGADIRLTYELLDGIKKDDIPTINNSRYFLLELPDPMPPNLDRFLFSAGLKGLVPIITHPERNYSLFSSPEKLGGIRDAGALLQVTAMSITGEFGPQIQRFTCMLLKKGFVDLVASDAHNTAGRVPVLSKAYGESVRYVGREKAGRIFSENPEAVINNRTLSL